MNTMLSKREPGKETTTSVFRKTSFLGREDEALFGSLMPPGVKGMGDCRAKGSPALLIRAEDGAEG